ncbi:ribosomal-processing cysteine protease Prp [Spiroplasma sp. TIUS-1]|uniref:ribosomal-processing cysteine protease Prp n=1 Tax=Spiroplasma sp. TIUS-1 TaxID=216963 RepID=UPI001397C9C2|nr:ribosomal-processing cysteine protease Prp [Spiroplasma sp. TIUS-1]QHX36038.1 ribosomal-processing cysteine protease Prp [Spiroplasma sp. TIUS-1]
MIKTLIKKCNNNVIESITVTGHANAGKFGNDLICAGVTAIMIGALNALELLADKSVNLKVLDNEMIIKVLKKEDLELQRMLLFIKIQLQTIEVQYPKNLKIMEE